MNSFQTFVPLLFQRQMSVFQILVTTMPVVLIYTWIMNATALLDLKEKTAPRVSHANTQIHYFYMSKTQISNFSFFTFQR